ncbi:MAG: DUF4091 domain-containing protein [Clostridiales bacterium]|nr:DUF4091 domain-containing protein [Clostridiales bacterium]
MGFNAALFDELTPIYPDTNPRDGFAEYTVAGCNGTAAGVHIMLTGLTPGLPVTVSVKGGHRCFKLFELLPVPVEVNSGAKQRTEYLKNDVNENVIRRAPFTVYEALDPFYNIYTPPYAHSAIAFKTPVEYCREKRVSAWEISVQHNGETRTLTLNVEEYPCEVPKAGSDTFNYVNWFDFDRMAWDFRCEKWSDAHFYVMEQYFRAAVFSRQNVLCVGVHDMFDKEDGRAVLNAPRLDKILAAARKAGFQRFHGGAFALRKNFMDDDETYASLDHRLIAHPEEIAREYERQAFDVFDNEPNAFVRVTGERLPGDEGEAALLSAARQLYAYLKRNRLTDSWYQCCLDEPNATLEPVYRRICELVKQAMPGIPVMEPTLEGHPLEGTMDIWCPSPDKYEQQLDFYKERVKAGEKIWVYTCLTPAGNYCNRLLDMERLRAVWVGWSPMVYTDIEGFLHWGGNGGGTGRPFRRQAAPFYENVLEFHPKHSMFLPAGDCAIFYPGKEQPMISVRSEAHRIGFEDLCLLERLKEKSPGSVMPIVNKVFRKFDDFEKDTAAYRAVRRELLEALV